MSGIARAALHFRVDGASDVARSAIRWYLYGAEVNFFIDLVDLAPHREPIDHNVDEQPDQCQEPDEEINVCP